MAIIKRNIEGNNVYDPSAISAMKFSSYAGSDKVSEVGRKLAPLIDASGDYSTDASSAAIPLPSPGKNLAIYNNDTAVHAVTTSNSSSTAALAAGATNADGNVGVACAPASWTYVACGSDTWVITDNTALIVYLIVDHTYATIQKQTVAST